MAVKLTKLKATKIRATIPVIVEGVKEEIKIFNPTPEQREYFHKQLDSKVNTALDEDGTIKITANDILTLFYTELTDLEIDENEDILEIIANPSKEILLVAQHINQIVHELVMEMMINKQLEINRLQEMKKQGELVEDTKKVLASVGITEEMLDKMTPEQKIEMESELDQLIKEEKEVVAE